MSKKTYYSLVTGFVNNVHRKEGEPVGQLTDAEAKYLVMAGQISDEPPVAEKPRRTRAEKAAPAAPVTSEEAGE